MESRGGGGQRDRPLDSLPFYPCDSLAPSAFLRWTRSAGWLQPSQEKSTRKARRGESHPLPPLGSPAPQSGASIGRFLPGGDASSLAHARAAVLPSFPTRGALKVQEEAET